MPQVPCTYTKPDQPELVDGDVLLLSMPHDVHVGCHRSNVANSSKCWNIMVIQWQWSDVLPQAYLAKLPVLW